MSETVQTSIYVGLPDSVTNEQRFDTEKYISVLRNVCKGYKVPYSAELNGGGNYHEDGTYVEENSLVLTLLGAPSDVVDEIAQDLCVFFHQESAMIVESTACLRFINPAYDA